MGFSQLLSANLTTYERVELWVSRSALFISFAIICPTIILIILDFLLWCFRAGQGPSVDLLRRSKSGIDNLQQRVRSRSNSQGSIDKGLARSTALDASETTTGRRPNVQNTTEEMSAITKEDGRVTFIKDDAVQAIQETQKPTTDNESAILQENESESFVNGDAHEDANQADKEQRLSSDNEKTNLQRNESVPFMEDDATEAKRGLESSVTITDSDNAVTQTQDDKTTMVMENETHEPEQDVASPAPSDTHNEVTGHHELFESAIPHNEEKTSIAYDDPKEARHELPNLASRSQYNEYNEGAISHNEESVSHLKNDMVEAEQASQLPIPDSDNTRAIPKEDESFTNEKHDALDAAPERHIYVADREDHITTENLPEVTEDHAVAEPSSRISLETLKLGKVIE